MLHVHHHDANLSEIPLVGDTAILKETFSGTYMHMEKLINSYSTVNFQNEQACFILYLCVWGLYKLHFSQYLNKHHFHL